MRDPLVELLHALDAGHHPTLAWVVRWGAGGEDPVAAAWARSWSPAEMARLLEIGGHPEREAARRLATATTLFDTTDVDRARADAIRRVVRTPPALADLMRPRARTA